jgi:hypothetical protein
MQFGKLKRREFISLLGGAAARPLVASAQPAPVLIAVLNASAASTLTEEIEAFRIG